MYLSFLDGSQSKKRENHDSVLSPLFQPNWPKWTLGTDHLSNTDHMICIFSHDLLHQMAS